MPATEPRPDDGALSRVLGFPAVARLELDELLDQLIARATEVKTTQGRLRGLLDATQRIAEGLDLDELVRRIVDSARDLVGARYAALGVVRSGRLIRFVHAGMDDDLAARIGALPAGRGVLGCLIDDPKPLRLEDLTLHDASVGVPDHHPPMRSFLGVPLSAGGTVYGNLYLTEATRTRSFTDEDEQLITALAGAAGIAIENALLLEASRRRERWQRAAAALARDLLPDGRTVEDTLSALLRHVRDGAAADTVALTVVDAAAPGEVRLPAVVGVHADWDGRTTPLDGSVTAAALDADGRILVADARHDPRIRGVASRLAAVGSVLAVPLPGDLAPVPRGRARSVLLLVRTPDAEPFTEADGELVDLFTGQMAAVAAGVRAREDRLRIRRLEDREEVVGVLAGHLVDRAGRIALALSSLATTATPADRRKLLDQVDALDAMTRTVRGALVAD